MFFPAKMPPLPHACFVTLQVGSPSTPACHSSVPEDLPILEEEEEPLPFSTPALARAGWQVYLLTLAGAWELLNPP